jgi:glycerol-3-phosphate acyltransferase PlsY
MALVWILLSFAAGSLPFSVWLGRFALRQDIRDYGDQNPGCSNVLRAGGWRWGALALLLDVFKGVIPVGLAYFVAGQRGIPMIAIALAAPAGHAFSPFLGGRGGKAIATTFGMWIGLTIGEAPIMLGLFFALFLPLLTIPGWAVVLGAAGLLLHFYLNHPDPLLLAVSAGSLLLLAWTHRADLRIRPGIRPELLARLGRVKIG